MAKKATYDNESISSLKGADRVRKRPGVIFGSDGLEGCEHAVFEILSNAIDEARGGHGKLITVTRFTDRSIQVEDQGRGCPVDWNEKERRYNWELVFCELYAGGKYDNENSENYEFSLGLNGLGSCATQYASRYMDVTVWRDGKEYRLHFERGEIAGKLEVSEQTGNKKRTGTTIRWLPDLIVTAYTFAATLAVILHYDWVMALLALASAPFLLLTSRRLIRGMRTHQQEVRQVGSRLMSYETETLHNLDAIKGFGITGRYGRGFRSRQEEFRRASLDYNLFSIRTEILLSLLGSAVQMAAFGYCLYLLWSGKILYGTMTLFLSQGAKLSSAFNALVRTVPSFLSASVSARRIRDLYALEPEPVLPDDGLDSLASQGFTVAVEDASYAYVPHQPVLTHADFRAAPGETVALVGPSGGGKTTMIRLLLGLIRPAEGRAYLQAADGRQVEVNAGLRRYFSYVPQGNTLLSGTIADNLRMVKPDASDAQLRAALEAACAWDFVSAMDGGLDASVGEHGHGLSEGQAQRIAIARALLRDAPVLLLDEATSALDVATERTILRNLAARYPHKTCIVTTHRPTVISLCRRVYQVSSGCLRLLDSDEAQRLAMDF